MRLLVLNLSIKSLCFQKISQIFERNWQCWITPKGKSMQRSYCRALWLFDAVSLYSDLSPHQPPHHHSKSESFPSPIQTKQSATAHPDPAWPTFSPFPWYNPQALYYSQADMNIFYSLLLVHLSRKCTLPQSLKN